MCEDLKVCDSWELPLICKPFFTACIYIYVKCSFTFFWKLCSGSSLFYVKIQLVWSERAITGFGAPLLLCSCLMCLFDDPIGRCEMGFKGRLFQTGYRWCVMKACSFWSSDPMVFFHLLLLPPSLRGKVLGRWPKDEEVFLLCALMLCCCMHCIVSKSVKVLCNLYCRRNCTFIPNFKKSYRFASR